MVLPPVYESHSDLLTWRQRLTDNLAGLHAEGVAVDITHDLATANFYLIYQGLDNRALQCQLAPLCSTS